MLKPSLFVALCCALVAARTPAQFALSPTAELLNGGFEYPAADPAASDQPENWWAFGSSPDGATIVGAEKPHSGSQALVFKTLSPTNSFQGVAQEFAVTPRYRYSFSVFAVNDEVDRMQGDSFGQIHFEWRDANGKEIGRTYGPIWKADLPCKRWERFLVEGDAPNKAVTGLAVIMLYNRNSNGRGTFYVDDCELSNTPPQAACPTRNQRSRDIRLPPSPPCISTNSKTRTSPSRP